MIRRYGVYFQRVGYLIAICLWSSWPNSLVARSLESTLLDVYSLGDPFSIVQERDTIWVGTSSGLIRIHDGYAERLTRSEGLPSNHVRAILNLTSPYQQSNLLLVGTDRGAAVCTPSLVQEEGFIPLHKSPSFPGTARLHKTKISAIFQSDQATYWFSSPVGLFRYTRLPGGKQGDLQLVVRGLGQVQVISEDPQGTLWIGSARGLFYLDESLNPIKHPSLAKARVYALQSLNSQLMVATAEGLFQVDRTKSALFRNREWARKPVRAIFQDPESDLVLLATELGIVALENNQENFLKINRGLGGLFSPRKVSVIEKDHRGDYWFGSSGYVVRSRFE